MRVRIVSFGGLLADVADDLRAVAHDVQRIGLGQPDVPVDARAFVEPAFELRRVDAHRQHVLAAVVGKVGDVVGEAGVAAFVAADDVAVDPDEAVAEHAVELDAEPLARVGAGDVELLAIPADAGGGIVATDGFAACAPSAFCVEGQLDGPVVRQVELSPVKIDEFEGRPRRPAAGFGVGVAGAEAEVLGRIGGVAELEAPALVEQQPLAG